MRRATVGLAGLILVAACSPAQSPAPAASGPDSGQAGASTCAWPEEADAYNSNALLLDTSAAYWIHRFTLAPGLRILVSGTFPDARYASLQVYSANGSPFTRNGVGSTLTDYQIGADQGSVNPWQQAASPGGHYTVTLREDVQAGEPNTIPIAPDGASAGFGLLVYRVYLPANGDLSKIPLPSLTMQQGGGSTSLAPCTSFYTPLNAPRSSAPAPAVTPTATPQASATAPPAQLEFFRDVIAALAPNTDTPYILAYLTPPSPTDVVVIRGRAPTHAQGDHPSPWPASGAQVRYWSLCSGLATGVLPTVMNLAPITRGIDTGCRADEQVKLDTSGEYAFVLGTEAQRPQIMAVPGATFLPFSSAQPATTHLLLFRDMLVDPGFVNSPGRLAESSSPAATQAIMGPYYPRAAVCPLSTLVASGLAGCSG